MDSEHSQPTALAWAERAESFRKMTATATGGNPPRVRPDLSPPPVRVPGGEIEYLTPAMETGGGNTGGAGVVA